METGRRFLYRGVVRPAFSLIILQSARFIANFNGYNSVVIDDKDRLSSREREVLTLRGQGLSTNLIAERLKLGPSTIETYRERLKSIPELIRYPVLRVSGRDGQKPVNSKRESAAGE